MTATPETDPPEAEAPGDVPGSWKSHARLWEGRAKRHAAELEDLRSEVMELRDRTAMAESEAADARRELARMRIAAQHGLPTDLVHGDNEDEMRSYAVNVAAWRVAKAPPRRPTAQF